MAQDDDQKKPDENAGKNQASEDEGSLPDPKTGPVEGTVETEKHGYASELIAYRVIDNLALVIANRVDTTLTRLGQKDGARLLLVDDLEHALGGLALAEIRGQTRLLTRLFTELESEHQDLLPPEEAAGAARAHARRRVLNIAGFVPAVTSAFMLLPQLPKAVGTVADVLGYFRSNYKISGREVSVSKKALLASAAGLLTGRGLKAFIPGFYVAEGSEVLDGLTDLAHRAARLKTGRDTLAAELPEKEEGDGNSSETAESLLQDRERLAKVAATVRETDAALLAYEGFRTAWTTPPEGEEETTLDRALLQEGIKKQSITHLLWLGNFSSGGETTVRDRLLFEDRIGFMGGAAVGYVLASPGGEVLAADTLAQFGITGGEISELSEGRDFEGIDYKPPHPHGRYGDDT